MQYCSFFSESGKILFEQNFKDSIPNGVFREYDENGNIKSELFYIDGNMAEKPEIKKKKELKEPELEANLLITVKTRKLARGERFSFYMSNSFTAFIVDPVSIKYTFRIIYVGNKKIYFHLLVFIYIGISSIAK